MSLKRILYPAVRRSSAAYTLHGRTIPEPYDYLENPAAEETKAFVQAQNDLFESYMQPAASIRDKVAERVRVTLDYPRTECPGLHGGKYYYKFNSGLQNQSVIMRTQALDRLEEAEVFLDPNTLSSDGTSAVRDSEWSKDERLLAYAVSEKGSDWMHIRVRDATTKEDLPDVVHWVKFSRIAWWRNEGFFYTRYAALAEGVDKGAETDSATDAHVCFHRIGTTQDSDIEVFRVPEHPNWILEAEVSDCQAYLIVTISDGCEPNNLIWIAPLPSATDDLKKPLSFLKLVDTFEGSYEYLGNDGETLFFTCTKDAPRKKVISIHLPTKEVTEIVPERTSVLNHAVLVRDTLLLVYLEDVKDVVYYCHLASPLDVRQLPLPIGSIHDYSCERSHDFVSLKLTSFLLPGRTYTLDIRDPEGTLRVFVDDVVKGLDPSDFVTEQVFYESGDVKIPMFIVHRKGAVTSSSPVLLYGYGGFNISLSPYFAAPRTVFLQHFDGVFAIANIRGGGEYGQAWHDGGRRAQKQNCFTDFVNAAKYLHAHEIGSPATTAIMGGSNGGLLVAACANQAPAEFRCVVCQVGVLDMYKFHKFTIGHAWTSDYGNPDVKEDFEVVEKYSPLHNVRASPDYPAVLVVTGDHDDRVVPLHSLKYVAALQHTNPTEGGPFLARIEVSAGHGAGKPTSKIVREAADIYTFISKHIGAVWHD
ncbi:prolyl oligopeptidase [Strigomonas culicis]|uniref:Prolyl endopeptidase n=1 Tax=Strigomonas culicis TaxID=28005 RepID=S9TQS0_9TRYP|nr:prolyl oligopeptidase [Strigomonas culicis]|eukprot:EPY18858.1 prolyl oligopeptidase [Strigomonas culicis]